MKNLQKGSIVIIVLSLVVVLLVIAFGVYVYSNSGVSQQAFDSQTSTKVSSCNYAYLDTESFLATTTDYLLIDSGTAPGPRGLTFYDLNKCEKVLTVRYSKPVDVKTDSITYWEPIDTKPTEANCPDLSEWESSGLGAGIESRVTINMKDLSKKSLNQFRCSARQ